MTFLSQDKFGSAMSVKEHMIYSGKGFRSFFEIEIPAAVGEVPGQANVHFTIGDTSLHLFKRLINSDQPAVRYEVRSGATFTGDTGPIAIRGLNGIENNPTKCTAQFCTISDIGTLEDLDIVGGSIGAGNRAEGATMDEPEDLKILSKNQEVLLHLTNPNVDPANVMVYLKWYELPYSI